MSDLERRMAVAFMSRLGCQPEGVACVVHPGVGWDVSGVCGVGVMLAADAVDVLPGPTDEQVEDAYIASRMGITKTEHKRVYLQQAFRRWLADHDADEHRAAAEKALREAATNCIYPIDPYDGFDHESLRAARVQITNWLRDRADTYRKEHGNE